MTEKQPSLGDNYEGKPRMGNLVCGESLGPSSEKTIALGSNPLLEAQFAPI